MLNITKRYLVRPKKIRVFASLVQKLNLLMLGENCHVSAI